MLPGKVVELSLNSFLSCMMLGEKCNISRMALNAHFLTAGAAHGKLLCYQCKCKAPLDEFRHSGAVTKLLSCMALGEKSEA